MKALTYYQRNKAKVLRKTRQTRLTSRGGKVYQHLKKRPYTGLCELCDSYSVKRDSTIRLEYHHWDDNRPSMGLWLCHVCHLFAEAVEAKNYRIRIDGYLVLKKMVETYYHELEPLYSPKWKRK